MPSFGQFFGFEEDHRIPEGWLSWQHLTYTSILVIAVILFSVRLGMQYKNRTDREKKKPLRIASIMMIVMEITKIILISVRNGDPWAFRSMLPLFICSIILFTLPIAAFGEGRISGAATSFTLVFGMLCCIAGTYLAANYYQNSPIFSFDPMVSNVTHCIAGFSAVYIGVSGLAKREPGDYWHMSAILGIFEAMALTVNQLQIESDYESNYMFFTDPSGTPFSLCMDLVGEIQPLYTAFVGALYFGYLFLFLIFWKKR